MTKTTGLKQVASVILVCRAYKAGQSISEIAVKTNKSKATIYRWLKIGGIKKCHRR